MTAYAQPAHGASALVFRSYFGRNAARGQQLQTRQPITARAAGREARPQSTKETLHLKVAEMREQRKAVHDTTTPVNISEITRNFTGLLVPEIMVEYFGLQGTTRDYHGLTAACE